MKPAAVRLSRSVPRPLARFSAHSSARHSSGGTPSIALDETPNTAGGRIGRRGSYGRVRELRQVVLEPLRRFPTDLSALRRTATGGRGRVCSKDCPASDRHVGCRQRVRDRVPLDDRQRCLRLRPVARAGCRLGRRLRPSHLGKRLVAPRHSNVRARRAATSCLEHVVLADPRADRRARVRARAVLPPLSRQRSRRERDEPPGPPVDRRGRRFRSNLRGRRRVGRSGDAPRWVCATRDTHQASAGHRDVHPLQPVLRLPGERHRQRGTPWRPGRRSGVGHDAPVRYGLSTAQPAGMARGCERLRHRCCGVPGRKTARCTRRRIRRRPDRHRRWSRGPGHRTPACGGRPAS